MKRQIITLVMAMMAVLTVSAQKKLVVIVGGEEVYTTDVWRVDEIKFVDGPVETLTDKPDTLDFGLSVRWADRNMGAASPKDRGRLIGWGDTTLTNYSTKSQYFPIKEVTNESSISGSQYDVAKVKWNNKWHMPTEAEMQELVDACNWSWVAEGDSVGVIGKLKTDETKTIFFPVTGYREGEANPTQVAKGYYWTGSIAKNQTEYARIIGFSESSAKPTASALLRCLGAVIRPVTGPVKMPTKIESANVVSSSIKTDRASITVNLSGDMDDYEFVIVSYGTAESQLSYSNTTDAHHQKTTTKAKTITINLSNLSHKTTYYVKVYVKTTDGRLESGVISFTTAEAEGNFPKPEYVDLGLRSGVKWAKWNMGSKGALHVPSNNYARYYFGEPTGEVRTPTSSSYTFPTTTYAGGNYDIGGTQYDIATVKWGAGWRTPSTKHFEELEGLTWQSGTYSEDGYSCVAWKVTGRNGNYIYLPINLGCITSDGQHIKTTSPFYWTSENLESGMARYLDVSRYSTQCKGSIYTQMAIRPIYVGDAGTTTPDDPIDDPNPNPNPNPNDNTPDEVELIDLGLSVKWASKNIGADYVVSYGEYYAWGDTVTRSVYDRDNYIYLDSSGPMGLKYLGTSSNHSDSYSISGTQYDAARAKWGGTWRLPTEEEFYELKNNCTWTWKEKTENGITVSGYEISRAGYSQKLFLPAAGRMSGDVLFKDGEYAYYWTGDLESSIPQTLNESAYVLSAKQSDVDVHHIERFYGLPIRPVQPK